jgi:hypothetical protein
MTGPLQSPITCLCERSEAIPTLRKEIASPQKARLAMTMDHVIRRLSTVLAAASDDERGVGACAERGIEMENRARLN